VQTIQLLFHNNITELINNSMLTNMITK